MIVRQTEKHLTLVEQHDHGQLAADIMTQWQDTFLQSNRFKDSILYAIAQHDKGWHPFDKHPFWNELTNEPYSFIDYPLLAKLVIYTYGIDQVEKVDPYAAVLCSAHYATFLKQHDEKEVKKFLYDEQSRRKRIFANLEVTEELFERHLALLQFADNFSLFICLHDRESYQKQSHPFFNEGIPIPKQFPMIDQSHLQATWDENDHIYIEHLPVVRSIQVYVKETTIDKDILLHEKFTKIYSNTKKTIRTITISPKR